MLFSSFQIWESYIPAVWKTLVKKSVKTSPLQSVGDLLRSEQVLQDTHEAIDFSLKKSSGVYIMLGKSGVESVCTCWKMWR